MPQARERRGDCVESVHEWSAALARDDGRVEWIGSELTSTWRSAAKPFQLACSLELLGDPADLDEDKLAVGAASHSAEPVHVAIVDGLLARFGLRRSDLRCAPHAPFHDASAEAILRAGGDFEDIHNNCSGKHSFMIAAAIKQGWERDVRAPEHPLQRHIRRRVVEWTENEPGTATDGCGVPTFCLPVSAMARAYAKLAAAMAEPEGDEAARLSRIGWAMAKHPELTSGSDRFDRSVVLASRVPMAAKVGARGVFCMAFPEQGAGLAVKVHTGFEEALPSAVAGALNAALPGVWQEPGDWSFRHVKNVAGRVVGHWE